MNAKYPTTDIRLLALVGSYRSGSLNQALLETASQVASDDLTIVDFDLRELPYFDEDLEADPPSAVVDFVDAVRGADAILIVTPEYNSGLPGVLKNAIDWASRGYPNAPLGGKIAGIMGASPGPGGTASAQAHLRQVLGRVGAVVEEPSVAVGRAHSVVDDGQFTDDTVRADVAATLNALIEAVCVVRDCGSISAVM